MNFSSKVPVFEGERGKPQIFRPKSQFLKRETVNSSSKVPVFEGGKRETTNCSSKVPVFEEGNREFFVQSPGF